MSPTFQSVLQLTLCMLVLVIMIGFVCWCCSIVYSFATYGEAEANRDMARGQLSVPIVVYSHHSEARVSHGTENSTLAPAMNRPPAEVPENSNNTVTTTPCVVWFWRMDLICTILIFQWKKKHPPNEDQHLLYNTAYIYLLNIGSYTIWNSYCV